MLRTDGAMINKVAHEDCKTVPVTEDPGQRTRCRPQGAEYSHYPSSQLPLLSIYASKLYRGRESKVPDVGI